jgi:hypothetical protein
VPSIPTVCNVSYYKSLCQWTEDARSLQVVAGIASHVLIDEKPLHNKQAAGALHSEKYSATVVGERKNSRWKMNGIVAGKENLRSS